MLIIFEMKIDDCLRLILSIFDESNRLNRNHFFQINLDMTTDLVDHVDKDIMEYADNVISTPGTISTPHSPQFVQSDQLSSGCSSLDDAVASSTPEKSSPESEPSTCTPIIKIPSGFQGQRTYHTIEPCYTPPPKAMNL